MYHAVLFGYDFESPLRQGQADRPQDKYWSTICVERGVKRSKGEVNQVRATPGWRVFEFR